MTRLTAKDFAPEVLQLFDRFVHGDLNRRGFVEQAARYTAGVAGAELVLAQLVPNFAVAQVVPPSDKRIHTSFVDYPSPQGYGKARGYLVKPANATAKLPLVLVVHENRGLNPHIEDIARRLALDNFIAFAPDALFPLGGYPGDEDKARELFGKLDQARTRADFVAGAALLKARPEGNGKLGVVGFCYGGGMANYLATQLPDLAAAVPFYGGQPPAEDVPRIKAALQLHYAGADERINAGWPKYEEALKAAKVRYETHIYPGAQHGFNNDTTPRFESTAAQQAWQRTVAFFNQHLRA